MAVEVERLADATTAAAIKLLDAYRKEILASLLAAEPRFQMGYRELVREIDALSAAYRGQLTLPLLNGIAAAAELGDADVLAHLRIGGIDAMSYVGVNPTLVRVASEYVANLTEKLMAEVNAKVTSAIRLAALGGMSFTDLVDKLGRTMNTGTFKVAKSRLETIAQTEVARLYNMAYYDQANELTTRYPEVRKRWIHAASSPGFTKVQRERSRENHIRCARVTAAEPIAMNALFDLGGEKRARYPHDPFLPATETNRCRCRLMLVTPDPKG